MPPSVENDTEKSAYAVVEQNEYVNENVLVLRVSISTVVSRRRSAWLNTAPVSPHDVTAVCMPRAEDQRVGLMPDRSSTSCVGFPVAVAHVEPVYPGMHTHEPLARQTPWLVQPAVQPSASEPMEMSSMANPTLGPPACVQRKRALLYWFVPSDTVTMRHVEYSILSKTPADVQVGHEAADGTHDPTGAPKDPPASVDMSRVTGKLDEYALPQPMFSRNYTEYEAQGQ